MRPKTGALIILLTVLGFTTTNATADDAGTVGRIAGLDVNTTSADTYLQYHGRLFLLNVNGTLDEYRWGGTSCGTRVLSEAQVAALQEAFNNKRMQVQPLWQLGQGDARCVVGFTLVQKADLKLFTP